jgi:acyl-CoA reductase-like NAD-dependent aldehyde dehydrogenase
MSTSTTRRISSLIGGRARNSPAAAREVRSPYDGRTVTLLSPADLPLLEEAVATAYRMREPLRRLPPHERAGILERLAGLVGVNREDFARMLCEEAGKPIALARQEVDRTVQTILDAAHCTRYPEDEMIPLNGSVYGAGRQGILKRFPIGAVAAITPFNFPLNLVAHKVAPAIAAGCPLVLKPASQTSSPAVRLAELAHESGLPAGALNVVLLGGGEADPLVTDDRIGLVTFTGSMDTGWSIKARCGKKKVALELGGNAGAIVEPDCDLEYAARRVAAGAFGYAGQSCISVQRVFVNARVAAPFTEALVTAAETFATGDPSDEKTLCGPLIDTANADRVERWIADAVARGARVLTGNWRSGPVIHPTILTAVPSDCEISCAEAFGPVMTLTPYPHLDDALALINDSRYGLQAGIFTHDIRAIWKAYETLEVGGLIQNDVPTFRADQMPYGGVKNSGLGREGARWAIEEMTEPRLLVISTG